MRPNFAVNFLIDFRTVLNFVKILIEEYRRESRKLNCRSRLEPLNYLMNLSPPQMTLEYCD